VARQPGEVPSHAGPKPGASAGGRNQPFPALLCVVQKKKGEKCMLQVYVSDVSEVRFQDSVWIGCCICYNGYTLILQASVPNVPSVFSDVFYKCVYLNVAYDSHMCYKCFIRMLHMFCNGFSSVFRCFYKCLRPMFKVFHLSSEACCKCFIWMFQI
jgi:hypothetical protein